MALIICKECGKEVSDQAKSCPNCGYVFPQQQYTQPYNSGEIIPKKNSGLSVAALILSILGCTFILGIIFAIVDLVKNDKSKKHLLSKIALGICAFWLIISFAVNLGGKKETSVPINTPVTESVQQEDPSQPEETVQPIETEPESVKEETVENASGYKSGTYKIGVDMPSGEYLITTEDSFMPSYLELTKDSTGALESIIANANFNNRFYITVQDGQYLKFDGIAIPSAEAAPYEAPDGIYSDGTYLVGKDIPAGEYKVKLVENIMNAGYFEVAKDSTGNLGSIITNSVISADTYQTIADGQYLKLTNVEISIK